MIKDVLLLCMVCSYLFPIYTVYTRYIDSFSISSIVCSEDCNKDVMSWMIIMGGFTILYEVVRNDNISTILILSLLLGIAGVLNTREDSKMHVVSSIVAFGSIILFMYYFSSMYDDKILKLLFYLQILFGIMSILFIKTNIFCSEVLSLLNFATFYVYLHIK